MLIFIAFVTSKPHYDICFLCALRCEFFTRFITVALDLLFFAPCIRLSTTVNQPLAACVSFGKFERLLPISAPAWKPKRDSTFSPSTSVRGGYREIFNFAYFAINLFGVAAVNRSKEDFRTIVDLSRNTAYRSWKRVCGTSLFENSRDIARGSKIITARHRFFADVLSYRAS